MIGTIRTEFVFVWYYFTVQLSHIFVYWVLGMLIGSAVSVFLKDRIHGAMLSLSTGSGAAGCRY